MYKRQVINISKSSCDFVLSRLNNCLNEIDKLDNWYHFRNLLSDLNDKEVTTYIDIAIAENIEPKHIVGAFQKQFYYQWRCV